MPFLSSLSSCLTVRLRAAAFETWGLPRSARVPFLEGLGSAYPPVALHLRGVSRGHPYLATCHFGPSLSASLACCPLRRLNSGSHMLAIPSNPSPRPPQGWQSQLPLTGWLPVHTDPGYIVPRAPHPGVTPDARPGRVLVTEHQIIPDKYSCTLVSHVG